jgi:hypothetical protein
MIFNRQDTKGAKKKKKKTFFALGVLGALAVE